MTASGEGPDHRAREFFEQLWRRGDPWELEHSPYEQARNARLLETIGDRRYGRTLEIGCGAGQFTRSLATHADFVLALDISAEAIGRARQAAGCGRIEYRVANAMDHDLRSGDPWDLIVLSETVYYLGWLYPFFNVAWLAHELFEATRPGGRLLLANTLGHVDDALLLPFVIRTYHDLFSNVGYRLESEDVFRGTKHDVAFEVLISLLAKP